MKPNLRNSCYLLSLTPAIAVIAGNLMGGIWVFLNIAYSLFFLGATEWITKPFLSNKHGEKQDMLPLFVLWLHIPSHILCIGSFMYGIHHEIITGKWIIGAAFSTGVNSGSAAIVVAHELIHRKNNIQVWFGRFLLFSVSNFYFYTEHLRMHHKWVGTEKDAATAKKGQHLYAFFLSSFMGQLKGSWKLEQQRLSKEGKSIWALQHDMIWQMTLHLILAILVVLIWGWLIYLAFMLHCLVAAFLLEYVNYIEHYGLKRKENERVTEQLSWQSDAFVSRFLLIDLSRHADHHYYASKPYHLLNTHASAPVLPSGYSGMFFIAAIPPLWFRMMDKKIPN